jgi:polysaccharide pyruvyl transferase CsaB
VREDSKQTKKVVIAGYYGHRNAGDEAILSGILAELRAFDLDLEFTVISGDPDHTARLHKVHAIGWKDFKSMIKEVEGASLVIVGGGGLIQDYWGVDKTSFLTHRQGGISEFGSPILLAKLFDVPSMFYAIGVGPLNTDDGRDCARTLFEIVDGVTVRDEKSKKLIEELGIVGKDIPVVPDPAIFVPKLDLPADFLEKIGDFPRPLLAASLRYWGIGVESEGWQPKISEALDQVLEKLGGTMLFMPFHISDYYLENDQVVCKQIQSDMRHKDHTEVLLLDLNPLERFTALSQFDFVFGMRLHALVAGLKAGLPCVAIAYDPKVRAFMDQMGLAEYCFNLSQLSPDEIAERTLTAYQNPSPFEGAAADLAETAASISQSAQIAVAILEKPGSMRQESSLLIDLAVQQTLNVAHSEEEIVRLNDLFRKVWAERLDPNFHFEHARTDLGWIESQLLLDHDRMEKLETENLQLLSRTEKAEEARDRLEHKVQKIGRDLSREQTVRQEMEGRLDQVQRERWELREQLSRIEHSKGFRILLFFWKILWRIRDPKQTIIEFRSGLSSAGSRFDERTRESRSKIFKFVRKILPVKLRHFRFIVDVHHLDLEDRSTVVLYAQDDGLFPGYQPRKRIENVIEKPVKVTLVTTVKNEAGNAQRWLQDLERQTRIPDEVVLLEGGSSDQTLEIIEAFARKSSLPIRLLSKPGTNIATRRNLGVTLASHPIIAMTDFGCTLKADWLEKMMVPFMADPDTEVVAGGYGAHAESFLGDTAKYELIPSTNQMDPQSFLPACRSIAFLKSAWEAVGGFPEWLTKTGEDTYFDLKLKKKCHHWAFVPEAQVIWHAPETLKGIWGKLSSWTVGDGESGIFVERYWRLVKRTFWGAFFSLLGLGVAIGCFWIQPILGGVLLAAWVLIHFISIWTGAGDGKGWAEGFWRNFGRIARVDGFLRGIRNRAEVMARRYADVRGVVLFLTGVPIDDTGGGARGTQIALELLRRGHLVVFVHKYPKQESVELNLDYDQPNLLHFSLDDFDWKALKWELRLLLKEKPLIAYLEFPFKEFLPLAKDVDRMGGEILYDLIDEWNTSLGGEWYSEKVESTIIEHSHVLVASAPSLVKRLEDASGREVIWMPNAVNLRLFDRHQAYDVPQDLPEGTPKILYIGALWGEWFDWGLLQKIAQTFPRGAVTVIGDYRGQCPFVEPNLCFLGLKPQTTLPAYLQHSDVAIIPWKIGPITQATSPLKIFEYLAMGTPVVAPKLHPLEGIPYVFLSPDHEAFLESIARALNCEMDDHVLGTFLRENSWQTRIDHLARSVSHFAEPGSVEEER